MPQHFQVSHQHATDGACPRTRRPHKSEPRRRASSSTSARMRKERSFPNVYSSLTPAAERAWLTEANSLVVWLSIRSDSFTRDHERSLH